MHHYSVVTSDTLSLRTDMQYVWRVIVPQTGYSSAFLTDGILALSAAHKAHLLPNQRSTQLKLAAYYQTAGLQGFRAVSQDVNDKNWQEKFYFSSLLIIYVFSLLAVTDKDPSGFAFISRIVELFVCVRGMRSTMDTFGPSLKRSQLAPLASGIWSVDEEDTSYR